MELVINTENKTVKVVGQCKLQELINTMTRMGLGLAEYSIIGTEKVLEYYPYYPVYPSYPSYPTGPFYYYEVDPSVFPSYQVTSNNVIPTT